MQLETGTFSMPILEGAIAARWYAVQTRSRFEQVVRAELSVKGVENYFATYQELHQWKDRKKLVEVPLFSGYVFARFQDEDEALLQVLRTTGVVRILGAGGIEPIPDEEIDSIRRLLRSGNRCFPHPFIREGAWVRVRRGVLAGIEGRLVRVKSQARLVLSVELLSQSVATEVDARDVEPARELQLRKPVEHRGLRSCTRI
jgi:transcription antitermination factor NusG